jgi:membrane-associated phospholipid phosphatase
VKALAALRSSEWLLIGYFGYVALLSSLPPIQPATTRLPFLVFVLAVLLIAVMAYGESRDSGQGFSVARDWVPLALMLAAYREMDWFTPLAWDHHLELRWIGWDRTLLYGWGLQGAVESFGMLLAGYLEFCYMLVYAVGPFTVAVLYFAHRRERVNRVLFLYLLGTLLAYAMFPYFPSEPPRVLFGGSDLPGVMTVFRRFNLWIVNGYGIHSSVFPSAHVSSAFSAAWALLLYLRERRRIGWGMLIYAVSVAVATVYGRYHYAVDAVAGFGVSLVACGVVLLAADKRR